MTMKHPLVLLALVLSVCRGDAPPPGFEALFNGRDLSGWWGLKTEDPVQWMSLPPEELEAKRHASLSDIARHWRVENGELVNDGQGLFLTTERNYGDFELLLEYKTVPRADSGVYLRGIPQVQIWDCTQEGKFKLGADKGSGGLWNNKKSLEGKHPLVRADKPFGEWNRMRILMVGERVTVHLNGHRVVDHARMDNFFNRDLPLPRTGPIQLQTHGGEIRWRNLHIRRIGDEEANRILAARPWPGAESLFDGKTSRGWQGATDNYLFGDGEIRCIEGKGGTVFTEKAFADFAVRLEFRLPPGGNNGLAIRYPGKGNPAYDGMCELQVLDDSATKYAKLDPRQFHGSAYGMAAAHRGYLREPGEWNYQEVTVRGSTVAVELNGTAILDADLSCADGFLGGKPHPGRDRTDGHFGFCGHKDPVAFRNIFIKELDHEPGKK